MNKIEIINTLNEYIKEDAIIDSIEVYGNQLTISYDLGQPKVNAAVSVQEITPVERPVPSTEAFTQPVVAQPAAPVVETLVVAQPVAQESVSEGNPLDEITTAIDTIEQQVQAPVVETPVVAQPAAPVQETPTQNVSNDEVFDLF